MKYSVYIYKGWLWLVFVALMASCSSEYVPGEKMLAYKKNLTPALAIEEIQGLVSSTESLKGICSTRGFWFDSNADFEVGEKSISLLAYKRGEVLEKHPQKLGDIIVFERQYYRYEFKFDLLSAINIYDDPRRIPVFTECSKKGQEGRYYIVDLFVDKDTNMKLTVPNDDFDRVMAALSLILPTVPVYMH